MSKSHKEYLQHIHDYFGVDYSIVWDIVENEIPKLKDSIENILKEI